MMSLQSISQVCYQVGWPGNSLKISFCALHFDLQAKGIFSYLLENHIIYNTAKQLRNT